MKKKDRLLVKLSALVLSGCIGITCAAWGQPGAADASAAETEPDLRVVGKDEPDSIKLNLTNKTGSDIYYISVSEYEPEYVFVESDDDEEIYTEASEDDEALAAYLDTIEMQKALIYKGYLEGEPNGENDSLTQEAVEAFRADNGLAAGSGADEEMMDLLFADYYPGNLLNYKEVIKDGETVELIYPVHDPEKEDSEDPENADAVLNQDYIAAYGDMLPEHQAIVGILELDDEDGEYYESDFILHYFPSEENVSVTLYYQTDEFLYLEYEGDGDEKIISTLDIEKAIYDIEYAAFLAEWGDWALALDEEDDAEVIDLEDLMLEADENGEIWYEDDEGNQYVEDADGNFYMVDESGNRTLVEEDWAYEVDDGDEVWYEDDEGNQYVEDADGNFYLVDESGNRTLVEEDWAYEVDDGDEVWYEDEEGNQYVEDADGNFYLVDESGNRTLVEEELYIDDGESWDEEGWGEEDWEGLDIEYIDDEDLEDGE